MGVFFDMVPQVALSWDKLDYTIPVKSKVKGEKTKVDKVILKNLSGGVLPGEMMWWVQQTLHPPPSYGCHPLLP